MPDSTQSQVALATRTISATDPDALALSTANVALGGIFTSRLNHQLREVRGWTYGMFSGVGFNKRTGVFQVRGSVVAAHTVDSLKDIEAELQKYAAGDITDAELAQAKEGILQSLPSALETNDGVASTFVTLSNLGRPLDWYATLPERLGKLGRDDVARVAHAYLNPGTAPGGGGGSAEGPGGTGGPAARAGGRSHCRGEGPRREGRGRAVGACRALSRLRLGGGARWSYTVAG